jgi:hypothetical protein
LGKQPLEIQTLYAELLERLVAYEAQRTIGHVPGTFVTKTVKGSTYYYFQHSEPGGTKRQLYVGPKYAALDRVVETYASAKADLKSDEESIRRLCASLRAGGALVTDASSARVLKGLADAGFFHLGGVLVGTHAYTVLGNNLGMSWPGSSLRTQDIGVATARALQVAVDSAATTDVPAILESLKMGFLPVPGLSHSSPSTSFKVRGQSLRVDLLTPSSGEGMGETVPIRRLGAAAQAMDFLDYAMAEPMRGAVIDGGGILVNVPRPERFAIHKLVVAGNRPAIAHTKRDKDLLQAAEVLRTLFDERPGDLELGWEALTAHGSSYVKAAKKGLSALESREPLVAARVKDAVG